MRRQMSEGQRLGTEERRGASGSRQARSRRRGLELLAAGGAIRDPWRPAGEATDATAPLIVADCRYDANKSAVLLCLALARIMHEP
jgi:hypothetical protein